MASDFDCTQLNLSLDDDDYTDLSHEEGHNHDKGFHVWPIYWVFHCMANIIYKMVQISGDGHELPGIVDSRMSRNP